MSDDPFRGGQPSGDLPRYPSDPWAVPGSAGWGYAGTPPEPVSPKRPRRSLWIIAVVVVLLAIGATGVVVLARRHAASTAAAPPPASAQPQPSTAHPSPTPTPSAPQASPRQALPSVSPASPLPLLPAGATPDPGSGPLDHYLLAPAEVGGSALMFLNDGGRSSTDQATLDWCNFTYTSEKLRTARVQVQYTSNNSQPAGNEFVRYQSGGTTKAWAELQQAVTSCPAVSYEAGFTYSHVERGQREADLLAHQIVLSYQVADSSGGLSLPWQAVVYQFDGNYFSGVYVYGQSRLLVLDEARRLGAEAARHLAEAVAGKPGTGGGNLQSFAAPSDNGVQD
jgi:hypothetical protein